MGVLTASRIAMKSDSPAAANQSDQTALAQIAAYIPSDVVATYVALQGIFSKGSDSVKWTLFGIGVALCALLPILNFLSSRRNPASAASGTAWQALGSTAAPPGDNPAPAPAGNTPALVTGNTAAPPAAGVAAVPTGVGPPAQGSDAGQVAVAGPASVAAQDAVTTAAAPAPSPDTDPSPRWGKQITVIIMAIVAFTAYAMALPSTVFGTIFNTATLWGAASALVLAVLMPSVAHAAGITPGSD